MARNRGEHASRRHRRVAPELVDVAVTDPDRFDPEHGAAGPEPGLRDLAELPGLITVEHDRTRQPSLPS
ncbi:hypothetical protein FMEAI12_5130028 [Parafrankia sp. Ea1.12]|nr:hypothetical protein FMEAI12_5130028 [Parafrankia sp. Ea1.12]